MQGRFEILSLTGSFTVSDNGGVRSRTGGLSVSLAGPDGRVVGGGIAGLLTAASPIQVRVYKSIHVFVEGSFCIISESYFQLHTIYDNLELFRWLLYKMVKR